MIWFFLQIIFMFADFLNFVFHVFVWYQYFQKYLWLLDVYVVCTIDL